MGGPYFYLDHEMISCQCIRFYPVIRSTRIIVFRGQLRIVICQSLYRSFIVVLLSRQVVTVAWDQPRHPYNTAYFELNDRLIKRSRVCTYCSSPTNSPGKMTQTYINIVVAFGNAEDSYYVGAGRRFAVQNMLRSLVDCVKGLELPITRLGWLRSVCSTGSLAFSQIDGSLF
jgi:hypothetical protein